MTRVASVNFAKGEVSDEIAARFDVQAYSAGTKRARNVRVQKYGGLAKRMGTRFIAEVFDPTRPVRLIPFEFSRDQTYVLELGQGYMRLAAQGGLVIEEELAITGISAAANAVIEAANHGYVVGDQIYLQGGFTHGPVGLKLNGRFWTVTAVVDDDHFSIDADTTGLTFAGWDGGITRTDPPPAPPTPPVVPPPVPDPDPPTVVRDGYDPYSPDESPV